MIRTNAEVLSIQYLRAVAAIAVVIMHIGEIFGHKFSFGATGVDLFFVISGFIMWMVSRQREASATMFVKKRLLRIVPLYWLVTLFLATCATIRPNLFPLDNPIPSHVLLSLFFIPHLSPAGTFDKPLISQAWTLNYEMFFYFLFALTLAGAKKYQFFALNALLLGSVLCGYLFDFSSSVGSVYTSPLLIEFLAGIYICHSWINNTVLSKHCAYAAIALGIIGIASVYLLQPQLPRIIKCGLPAIMIVFGVISLDSRNPVPKIRWLKLLGDASYAIYLVHFLAWLVVSIVVAKLGWQLNQVTYVVTVFTAIIAGVATHLLVEKPIAQFLSRRFTPRA